MVFAFINDGQITQYPVGLADIKTQHPNVSFPVSLEGQDLSAFNVVKVAPQTQPDFDSNTQKIEEGTPVLADGQWVQSWNIVALTTEERTAVDENKAASVRSTRNGLLSASDWSQLPDSPVDASTWATYRQALRDLPTADGFPHNITWPTQPS